MRLNFAATSRLRVIVFSVALCFQSTLSPAQDGGVIETIIGDEKTERTFHDNGKMKSDARLKKTKDGEWVTHGVVKTWYPSGKKRGVLNYDMGVKSGTWKTYYKNGKQYDERIYAKGEPTGTWKRFYENGKVMDESTFEHESETITNVRMKVYHESGKMSEEGTWRRELLPEKKPTNVKDGKWIYYDKEGKLTKTELYKKGKLQE